jgi:hypothetical protein
MVPVLPSSGGELNTKSRLEPGSLNHLIFFSGLVEAVREKAEMFSM